jgi:hypothetical protein
MEIQEVCFIILATIGSILIVYTTYINCVTRNNPDEDDSLLDNQQESIP